MDPDIALARMRELAESMVAAYEDPDGNGIDQDEANALAEYVQALDGWIAGGGFLPSAWCGPSRRTARTIGRHSEPWPERWPKHLIPYKARVVTSAYLAHDAGYTEEAEELRRPGISGFVVGYSDSHGLCYRVQHADGTEAYYEPSELHYGSDGVRSAKGEE